MVLEKKKLVNIESLVKPGHPADETCPSPGGKLPSEGTPLKLKTTTVATVCQSCFESGNPFCTCKGFKHGGILMNQLPFEMETKHFPKLDYFY